MRKIVPTAALLLLVAMLVTPGAVGVRAAQSRDWNAAASRREMREFRQFLNDHPWIANKLRQSPSLANKDDFLHGNPELPRFLNAHPFIQQAFRADAEEVMRREQDFETSPLGQPEGPREIPEARGEMPEFREFLNVHRRIAEQLKNHPALANDQDFLNAHPALPQFLNSHPGVQRALQADAVGVMRRMERFAPESRAPRPGPHAADIAELTQFMANHPWIGNKLRENPGLANNGDFLNDNKELKDFLDAHPYLREQFQNDPGGLIDRARESAAQN